MGNASLISTESLTTSRRSALRTSMLGVSVSLAAAILSACSGGSGADVQVTPGTGNNGPTANYNGPAPTTPDEHQFKINLWDNTQTNNRCGSCHSDTGGQSRMF